MIAAAGNKGLRLGTSFAVPPVAGVVALIGNIPIDGKIMDALGVPTSLEVKAQSQICPTGKFLAFVVPIHAIILIVMHMHTTHVD